MPRPWHVFALCSVPSSPLPTVVKPGGRMCGGELQARAHLEALRVDRCGRSKCRPKTWQPELGAQAPLRVAASSHSTFSLTPRSQRHACALLQLPMRTRLQVMQTPGHRRTNNQVERTYENPGPVRADGLARLNVGSEHWPTNPACDRSWLSLDSKNVNFKIRADQYDALHEDLW